MHDREKSTDSYGYPSLDFNSRLRRPWPRSRSPSPIRSPIYRFRRRSLLRILLLVTAIFFLSSSIERACTGTDTAERLFNSVNDWLSVSDPDTPFIPQSPIRTWGFGKVHGNDDGFNLTNDEWRWSLQQEDETGVRQIRNAIPNTINNTVIVIPTRSRDMIWVDNLSCRFSFLKLSNVLYWAVDEGAATLLQAKGLRFYYSPLLEVRNPETRTIEEAKQRLRLWSWVIQNGIDLFFVEPTVAIFENPMHSLNTEIDFQPIVNETTIKAALPTRPDDFPIFSTGVLRIKATNAMVLFLNDIETLLNTGLYRDETDALNVAIRENPEVIIPANPPDLHNSSSRDVNLTHAATSGQPLRYRLLSPFRFINHPIFEHDMHLHTQGYTSAFSLRDSNWDAERFFPDLLYVQSHDMERYEAERDDGTAHKGRRMIERWRSLGWWELDSEEQCAFTASIPSEASLL
jgi:hypothetical protein